MTEDEAIDWVVERFGQAAFDRLDHYRALVVAENERQNLISRGSIDTIWSRHLVDSAQLLDLVPVRHGRWIDVGSGPGLPGLVVALLSNFAVTLVEPRRRRVDFLSHAAEQLNVRATIAACRVEDHAGPPATVISARAVAAPSDIFDVTRHLRAPETVYVLPRGKFDCVELETIDRRWHGVFHVEQSLTNAESSILVARGVAAR